LDFFGLPAGAETRLIPALVVKMTKETLFLQVLKAKELGQQRLQSSPQDLKSSPKGFDSSAQGNALGTRSPNHHQP
jgi:hypothetical protein